MSSTMSVDSTVVKNLTRRKCVLLVVIIAGTMDEVLFNCTDDENVTTSSYNVTPLPRENSPAYSEDQLYACKLYLFIMCGVLQLIISIIGVIGKLLSFNFFSHFRTAMSLTSYRQIHMYGLRRLHPIV